jgi:O-antigen ligase
MVIIPLLICFIIFYNAPIKGVYALAACIAFWLEWRVGARVGLIDVAVLGALLGLRREIQFQIKEKTPLRILVVLLCIVCICSSIFTPGQVGVEIGKRLWDVYKSFYIPLSFFVFYKVIKTKQQLKNVILLVVASSTVSAIFGIIQAITQKPITLAIGTYGEYIKGGGLITYGEILRAFGTLIDANNFGGFLIMPLSILLAILITNKELTHKRLLWLAAGLQVFAMLLSLSRGSLLGFALSFIMILLLSGIFKNIKVLVAITLLIVVIFGGEMAGFHIIPKRIKNRIVSIQQGANDDAMTPRFARWDYFLQRSLQRPLTGWGFISDQETIDYFEGIAVSPHNTYLFIAVQRGYIVLAIILLIIIIIIFKGIFSYRSINDPIIRGLNIGIISSFIGLFALSAVFDPYLQQNQVDIMFWLFVAMALKSSRLVENGQIRVANG